MSNLKAFPVVVEGVAHVRSDGMDLRDWFAGQALRALVCPADYSSGPDRGIASRAYAIADAMMAERSKANGR